MAGVTRLGERRHREPGVTGLQSCDCQAPTSPGCASLGLKGSELPRPSPGTESQAPDPTLQPPVPTRRQLDRPSRPTAKRGCGPLPTSHGAGAAVGPAGAAVLGDVLVPGDTGIVDPIHVAPVPALGQIRWGQVLMRPGVRPGNRSPRAESARGLLAQGWGARAALSPPPSERAGRPPPSQNIQEAAHSLPAPRNQAGAGPLPQQGPRCPKCRAGAAGLPPALTGLLAQAANGRETAPAAKGCIDPQRSRGAGRPKEAAGSLEAGERARPRQSGGPPSPTCAPTGSAGPRAGAGSSCSPGGSGGRPAPRPPAARAAAAAAAAAARTTPWLPRPCGPTPPGPDPAWSGPGSAPRPALKVAAPGRALPRGGARSCPR